MDGEAVITWSPDLSDAEPKRHYTTMGKTNLTDVAWVLPVNEAHHFFKVAVTMGEPGIARDVAATAGTSADDVSISWSAVEGASHYRVYRSTAASGSKTPISSWQTALNYSDMTAEPGVAYYYFVSAAVTISWQPVRCS